MVRKHKDKQNKKMLCDRKKRAAYNVNTYTYIYNVNTYEVSTRTLNLENQNKLSYLASGRKNKGKLWTPSRYTLRLGIRTVLKKTHTQLFVVGLPHQQPRHQQPVHGAPRAEVLPDALRRVKRIKRVPVRFHPGVAVVPGSS